jgi:hypothetical protein
MVRIDRQGVVGLNGAVGQHVSEVKKIFDVCHQVMGINQFGDGMFSEIIEASTKGNCFNFFRHFRNLQLKHCSLRFYKLLFTVLLLQRTVQFKYFHSVACTIKFLGS